MDLPFVGDLQYSATSLTPASAQSLCVLDLQAFVCCVVYEAKQRLAELESARVPDDDTMTLLPLLLSNKLATDGQQEWWSAAYKLLTNQAR